VVIIYILERVWVLLFLGVGDEGGFHEVRVFWGLGVKVLAWLVHGETVARGVVVGVLVETVIDGCVESVFM